MELIMETFHLGESTLWWPLLGCHILLFYRDVHVWMYRTSNFWKIFTIILHILLEYNLRKRIFFKFILFHKMGYWNIFVKMNVMYLCTQKHKYISPPPEFKKNAFMKTEGILHHDISHNLNHVINLKFFISTNVW
jgi:hypothetical protein